MAGIPAAGVDSITIENIKRRNPELGIEIERLNNMLIEGSESEAEFLRLCELLAVVGEDEKSEQILRANARVGEASGDLYKRLFGDESQRALSRAVEEFGRQFGVNMRLVGLNGLFSRTYSFHARGCLSPLGWADVFLPNTDYIVQFDFGDGDAIRADIDAVSDTRDAIATWSLPLLFLDGKWEREH